MVAHAPEGVASCTNTYILAHGWATRRDKSKRSDPHSAAQRFGFAGLLAGEKSQCRWLVGCHHVNEKSSRVSGCWIAGGDNVKVP